MSAATKVRAVIVAATLVLSGVLMIACTTSPPTTDVFGDSLMTQSANYFDYFTGGVTQNNDDVFPGTAPCDMLAQAQTDATATVQPSVVVLEFSGNALTPCISGEGYETPAYFNQYFNDTSTIVNEFVNDGAHVFLVGNAPTLSQVNSNDANWNTLNWMYENIAADLPGRVTFVNAGASVMSASGQFMWTQACNMFDGSNCVNGSVVVRAPDGQHFCPDPPTSWADWRTCPSYAAGALRYGITIASAVDSYVKTGAAPVYEGAPLDPPNVAPTIAAGQVDPYTQNGG